MPSPKSLAEAFNDKYTPVTEPGCWLWVGASTDRYGILWRPPRWVMAHRVAYELYVGAIPSGLCVCHKCDVTFCVNPDHLFLGTHTDNMRDMIRKGRKRISPVAGRHGNHARGEESGANKYPSDVIEAVREMYVSKACTNIAAIARHFHISESHARRIVHRQTWLHLP